MIVSSKPQVKKVKKKPVILFIMILFLLIGFGFTCSLKKDTASENKEEESVDYYVRQNSVFKDTLGYKDFIENDDKPQRTEKVEMESKPTKREKIIKKEKKSTSPPLYKEASESSILAYGSSKGFGTKKDLSLSLLNTKNSSDALNNVLNPLKMDSETRTNQKNKKKFIVENKKSENTSYVKHTIKKPISPYQIMSGTILPAVLITGINSDLPGSIIGMIRENIYDSVSGKYLLVPQGTRLLGRYDNMVSWGQNRVLLVWHRLIFPNGNSILLDGMSGTDLSGKSGVKDKVNNHYMKIAGAIFMSAFLNIGAKHVQNHNDESEILTEVGSALAKDVNNAGQKIVKRNLDIPPTLEVRPGYKFNVMVTKDIVLEVFK